MPVNRTPGWRIGDLVMACEEGLHARRHGKPCRLPGWTVGSPTLQKAFRVGYENARRMEGATDGTAR